MIWPSLCLSVSGARSASRVGVFDGDARSASGVRVSDGGATLARRVWVLEVTEAKERRSEQCDGAWSRASGWASYWRYGSMLLLITPVVFDDVGFDFYFFLCMFVLYYING